MRQLRFSCALAVLACGALAAAFPVLSAEPTADEGTATSTQTPRFVVYYFHGNQRCATCRKIEAYSEEAITSGFADEMVRGALAFRAVNVDEAQNKHYVQDFQLTNKSVVVVEYRDGEVSRFKNLNEIWLKVGDKEAYFDYMRDSTREFIGES
ncbi:MAG: nitrophenyl compound nitroreductase subunit ArsF family protein [Thermoanaerobaculales bacterium]|jgi:hypothetical protein|nr:nitrophenyl compound nitroreductase subunit ArsF family protein [Thermoanaerobaculales bacterium]